MKSHSLAPSSGYRSDFFMLDNGPSRVDQINASALAGALSYVNAQRPLRLQIKDAIATEGMDNIQLVKL